MSGRLSRSGAWGWARAMACVLAGVLLVTGAAPCKAESDPLAIGRRIFREGILPGGQLLQGVGAASVTLAGASAACATCHRRSGYGSSEGPIEVRAITGPALFGERVAPSAPGSLDVRAPPVARPAGRPGQTGQTSPASQAAAQAARAKADALRVARSAMFSGSRQRPTYTDDTLARAIREGIDVTGGEMNASMPRYALDDAALDSLTAYLKTLSSVFSPGVTEDKVHFATVIQPGSDPVQRRALVEVLQTFMRDRNLGQRAEVRRELAGQVHLGRSYREWVLHVWDLSGTSDSWGTQLESLNLKQPVFALVSGLGQASWRPIHEFSERFEVPCILPQTNLPWLDEPDFYTVYLSKGMTLEAQALAKSLGDSGEQGEVTQVYRRDEASATAAAAFRKAWTAGAGLHDRVLETASGEAFWQQLASQASGGTLVLWLPAQDLAQARALSAAESPVKAVYLSASLLAGARSGLTPDRAGRVRLIYPQDLPAARQGRLAVVKQWLHNKGIELTEETVQMNAYLAATVTGLVVTHSKDTYSRDFMLERMEHRLGTANELSIYPHLSLGPGQRFASKGTYIVRVDGEDGQLTALSDWIVP